MNDTEETDVPNGMVFPDVVHGVWDSPVDGYRYLDLIMTLHSGVEGNDDYSVKISACGWFVLLSIRMARAITDEKTLLKILGRHDKTIENSFHPLFNDLNKNLSKMSPCYDQTGITKAYYIALDSEVERKLDFVKCLEIVSGTKILHVRLKVITKNSHKAIIRDDTKDIAKVDF